MAAQWRRVNSPVSPVSPVSRDSMPSSWGQPPLFAIPIPAPSAASGKDPCAGSCGSWSGFARLSGSIDSSLNVLGFPFALQLDQSFFFLWLAAGTRLGYGHDTCIDPSFMFLLPYRA